MEEKEYKYHLEKYSGPSSRHECPECGDKHSFVYYLDEAGNPVHESVGRCNHESSCGYHYKPSEYYHDNCINAKTTESPKKKDKSKDRQTKYNEALQPSFISHTIPITNWSQNSTFVDFLKRITKDMELVEEICRAYFLGATSEREVIFWQIDYNFHIRTGKIMKYDLITGKRDKSGFGINWIHAKWKGKKGIPDNFNLKQCLFGEHLLRMFPSLPVAVVESEKTAILGFSLFPDYVWVATGGISQTSVYKMRVLRGRRLILFPDADGFEKWTKVATSMKYCKVVVADQIERLASKEEKDAKIDVGDIFIAEYKARLSEETFGAPF